MPTGLIFSVEHNSTTSLFFRCQRVPQSAITELAAGVASATPAPQGTTYGAPSRASLSVTGRPAGASLRRPLLPSTGALGSPGHPLLPSTGGLGNPPQLRPDGLLAGPGVPYSFSWAVDEPAYGNNYGHAEESDGVVTQGEYRVLLPDGRTQIVTYQVEGGSGYQAQVTYDGEPQFADSPLGVAAVNLGSGRGRGLRLIGASRAGAAAAVGGAVTAPRTSYGI
ncbi:pro-resilin-like [Pollicipes pollicipes]|uniref:pro-resilin-like n=1 Tax=Pollicipes pollicipes TaxID=41117 RepID=UPI001884AEEC|nr:pro-resilin-like [Pollicipes pollicipes]